MPFDIYFLDMLLRKEVPWVKSADCEIPYKESKQLLELNNEAALSRAKANVDRYFPVVGVLEQLNETLAVLENKLPYFFKGVQSLYFQELLEPHKNRNRKRPQIVRADVRKMVESNLHKEYDFYYWLQARLLLQYRRQLLLPLGHVRLVRPTSCTLPSNTCGLYQGNCVLPLGHVRLVRPTSCMLLSNTKLGPAVGLLPWLALLDETGLVESNPFQTHCFPDNLDAPGINPGTSGSVARTYDH
uniref:Uncharacterized protein n=1 Tax=Timema shepardi TaxID=629360 RepID=A0A7R9G4V8_TIMSH|nr:unnamed protein product [Timema shepardi]